MKEFFKSFAESSSKVQLFTVVMTLFFLLYCACNASAETRREGNNFISVSSTGSRSDTLVTIYTYQVKEVKYPITINRKTTRCWIWKKGNKTKTYLPEEVEMEICKMLNIQYIPKKKRNK